MTPLRQELIEWCGFQYDADKNRFFRPSGIVNLRRFMGTSGNVWEAFILAATGVETPLCYIDGLGHLMQLVIAIEGDQNALQLKPLE
jgi:hypothetical protein